MLLGGQRLSSVPGSLWSEFSLTRYYCIVPTASAQTGSTTVFRDAETGFTFAQYAVAYQLGSIMTFRVAIPSSATNYRPYDAVVQIVAPNNVGWAGLAWAGRMTNNPLTVSWWSGQTAVVSSRMAQYGPPIYRILRRRQVVG